MPLTGRNEAEILDRAKRDAEGTLGEMINRRLKDIKPSFDCAYDRMSNKGKPGLFIAKTGGVLLGSVLCADGVYHLIAGSDEQVEDLFLHGERNQNYVRMFTGGCEVVAGALIASLAATKGPIR